MEQQSYAKHAKFVPMYHVGTFGLIVLTLIGIFAGIAVPTITSALERYAVLSAGQQVASTLRAARLEAVAKTKTLKVRFDYPAAGEYQVVDDVDTAVGDIQTLPSRISFSDATELTFSTEGRLDDPATTTSIVVANDSDQQRTITVYSSGRVELQ